VFEDEQAHPLGHDRPVDKVKFDDKLFSFYQKLTELRKTNQVLSFGDIDFILVDNENQLLAYSRYDESDEVIAVFNTSSESKEIEITSKQSGDVKDYFGNESVQKSGGKIYMTMPPRSGAVLVKI